MKLSKEILDVKSLISTRQRSSAQLNNINESDCEILLEDNIYHVFNTDTLAEEIFFKLYTDSEMIGYIAAFSALSDFSACCVSPKWALQSATWGPNHQKKIVQKAYLDCLEKHNVFLIGGDTSNLDRTIVSTTVFGNSKTKPITRKGAKNGDLVAIINKTGCAQAFALDYLNENKSFFSYDYKQVIDFKKYELLKDYIHCSIDSSDGILTSLNHLSLVNQLEFQLDYEEDWFTNPSLEFCKENKIHPLNLFITEHGDYSNIITFSEDNKDSIMNLFPELCILGTCIEGENTFLNINEKNNAFNIHSIVDYLYDNRENPHLKFSFFKSLFDKEFFTYK